MKRVPFYFLRLSYACEDSTLCGFYALLMHRRGIATRPSNKLKWVWGEARSRAAK